MNRKMAQLAREIVLFTALFLLLVSIDATSIDVENSLDIDDRMVQVVMLVMHNTSQHPSGLSIRAINDERTSECNVTEKFSYKWNAKSLSSKSVLVWLDDYNEDGTRQAKFILVNRINCKYQTIYIGALAENYQLYVSDKPSDETFSLMMRGKEYCKGHHFCRLRFNPYFEKLQPIDFDFTHDQLNDIRPLTFTTNPNLIVVSHTDDKNIQRIRLYDISNERTILQYKELFAQPNNTLTVNNTSFEQYPVKFSGLSLCWGNLTLDNVTHFYCSEFSEDGQVAFNNTISYPDSVVPSRLMKALPSKFLIEMVFDFFQAKDFSLFSNIIVQYGGEFERMKSQDNSIPWGMLLYDPFSSRYDPNHVIVIIRHEYLPADFS